MWLSCQALQNFRNAPVEKSNATFLRNFSLSRSCDFDKCMFGGLFIGGILKRIRRDIYPFKSIVVLVNGNIGHYSGKLAFVQTRNRLN